MPRPREFEEEEVLERAQQLFWKRGFAAASVEELVKATGLGRASLYATFGSKRALFLKVLERYRAGVRATLLGALRGSGTPRERLERFFEAMLTSLEDGRRRGCLLTQTAVELCTSDRAVESTVREFLQGLEDEIAGVWREARERGEIRSEITPRAGARALLAMLQGLAVLSKAHPDPRAPRQAVRALLDGLA